MKNPPSHWREVKSPFPDMGRYWMHALVKITVMRSRSTMENGDVYTHISMARPDRLPTWEELSKVKDEFLGEDVAGYHVVPAKKDYVNIHSFCLHIWAPEDQSKVANLQNLINEQPI